MTKPFQRGLIVGKFCPLHRGHEHAIRNMIGQCEEALILSYTRPEFPGCEPAKRCHWLTTLFPEARVLVLDGCDHPSNEAEERVHRRFVGRICLDVFQARVDAVFTSEAYGEGFARELSAIFGTPVTHVDVDPLRLAHPVSGTALRADVHGMRAWLSPVVYADFVRRVCVLGGESSGKSTLTEALASRFATRHVPEYGRELWERQNGYLSYEDLLRIAEGQIEREQKAAMESGPWLFCDTSPLTTLFYSESMFGRAEEKLRQLADRDYACHVLCAPDFPFVQDGTRKDEDFRLRQHEWYRHQLVTREVPWIEVGGSVSKRVEAVALALTAPPSHS